MLAFIHPVLKKQRTIFFLLSLWLFTPSALAQTQLVNALKKGKDQLVVVYGTSLSSGNHGRAWMEEVAKHLNQKYEGHLEYTLSGKGGMWSTWGIQHLEDSVIAKKPDAVIIEFGINDAFHEHDTSPQLARLNLEYMIDRVQLDNPVSEIILQIMNMPVGKSATYRPDLNKYYDMYREVATERKLLLIDHYPNWEKLFLMGEDNFLQKVPDGIHPSEESGREIIAPYILQRLEEGR